ncbi:hypothetical protein VE04_06546 [Pseudogymnoascus sp. 24MN13]|nr:hypothetical protein VE04_06546 [Pseudogymnoascus sp. 24MN13]
MESAGRIVPSAAGHEADGRKDDDIYDRPKPDEDLEEDLEDEVLDYDKLATKYFTNTREKIVW